MPRTQSKAPIGVEPKPWLADEDLRRNIDSAECYYAALGPIFLKLKCNSDTFEERCLLAVRNSALCSIEEDVVDCPVALTCQFLRRTQTPLRLGSCGTIGPNGRWSGAPKLSLIQ
jgi:hypothetical protein